VNLPQELGFLPQLLDPLMYQAHPLSNCGGVALRFRRGTLGGVMQGSTIVEIVIVIGGKPK
jgi:hypothetical protein